MKQGKLERRADKMDRKLMGGRKKSKNRMLDIGLPKGGKKNPLVDY